MALAQVQAALARLFTDAEARAAFARDPVASAHALGLDAGDAKSLATLAPRALDRFAGTLKTKRALDARKLLPLTAMALGEAFGPKLREALRGPPRGAHADALALAARLAAEATPAPPWIGDLARYEAALILARRMKFGLRCQLFRYPVLALAIAVQTGAAPDTFARRATLGLWARTSSGALRHCCWALGRSGF